MKQRRGSGTGFLCQKKRKEQTWSFYTTAKVLQSNKKPADVESVLSSCLAGKKEAEGE